MFLCGPPGTGKSTATKAMTNTLSSILEQDWTNVVEQATPKNVRQRSDSS